MSARPPFDPELAAALTEHRDLVVTSLTAAEIPALRRRTVSPDDAVLTREGAFVKTMHVAPGMPAVLGAPVDGDPSTGSRTDGAAGPDVGVMLLRPASASGPVPCLYHLHGGGLVTGTVYDDVAPLTELAHRTGCAVASVEYRLAPEHPYPAALQDAYSGLVWLADNAAALGLDPTRIVIEGISAGGGLAAATALLARDRGGPALAGQLLICPMLDDRNDSPSARQMVGHGAWDRTANATAWDAYLPGATGSDTREYAAPARAATLEGLPPTFIDVGSAETFRDEAVAHAGRMWLDGGNVELHVWPGGFHGFDYLAPHAAISQDARAARARWLTRLLRRPATRTSPIRSAAQTASASRRGRSARGTAHSP